MWASIFLRKPSKCKIKKILNKNGLLDLLIYDLLYYDDLHLFLYSFLPITKQVNKVNKVVNEFAKYDYSSSTILLLLFPPGQSTCKSNKY